MVILNGVSKKTETQKHTSKVAKQTYNDFGKEKEGFSSSSPDLNPLENVLRFIKEELRKCCINNKQASNPQIDRFWLLKH